MLRGCLVAALRPPFLDVLEGIVVATAIDEPSALPDPSGDVFVCLRVERLHGRIGEEQHLEPRPRVGIARVLQMRDADGDASLHQRKGQSVEVRELRVVVAFDGSGRALEHQGVRHCHADAPRPFQTSLLFKGQGAGGMGQEDCFGIRSSLAPCPLLLAPF